VSIDRARPPHIVKVDGKLGQGFEAGKLAGLDDVDGWRGGEAELMSRTTVGVPVAAENWRSLAACQWADPDLFFPISSSGASLAQVAQAKAICAGCQVRRDCLAFALRTHQVYGVWGGLSEQERYPEGSPTSRVTDQNQ